MTYRYKLPIRSPCIKCDKKFVRSSPSNKICPKCYKINLYANKILIKNKRLIKKNGKK